MKKMLLLLLISVFTIPALAQDQFKQIIDERADEIEEQVIEWRRHFHENPELSNREFETAAYIADYLNELGLEVETEVAHTGVVALLEGGQPG
ncbi:MAG TPA: amidohydrolase, partial [Balneolaceae bacterium]|nr:amidohydrolase [Balneolaceae bacterium]